MKTINDRLLLPFSSCLKITASAPIHFTMTIEFAKVFNTAAETVWELITDTCTWPKWGPSIRAVDAGERYIRLGSTGLILTYPGIWLPFTITMFEPERFWAWRVKGMRATGHRLVAIGTDKSRLGFTVPPWAFPYGVVCRIALNRIERLLTIKN